MFFYVLFAYFFYHFFSFFFFFNDTATTEIYTLSLHDALPILFGAIAGGIASALAGGAMSKLFGGGQKARAERSEERFSRNAETDLVCRLLLEKKKKNVLRIWFHQSQRQRYSDSTTIVECEGLI